MHSRTQLAKGVVFEYCRLKNEPLVDYETCITDIIADLLHLTHQEGFSAIQTARMAEMHFSAENIVVRK